MSVQEYTAATEQGDMAVIEIGAASGVPVIALHGWLDNAASFIPVGTQLRQVRLIALDLAGHGKSYHRAFPYNYNIWDDLIDILAVADKLQLDEFGILGHSRGAGIGNMLAATSPRVSRLALLDGFVNSFSGPEKAAANITDYLAKRLRGRRPLTAYSSLSDMVNTRINAAIPLAKSSAELIVARNASRTPEGFVWRTDQALRWRSAVHFTPRQTASFVAATNCPTKLWIAQNGIAALGVLPDLAVAVPHYELVHCQGSHHFHMETKVSELAGQLDEFFTASR